MDALAHVLRAFDDPSIPHVGAIDPLRDIKNVEFDLMVSDLGQIEKRLERLEKDLKKMKTPELGEGKRAADPSAKAHLETEKPLREMEMTPEDEEAHSRVHVPEREADPVRAERERIQTTGQGPGKAVAKYKLNEVASRPNAGATAICGKVEAELAEMSDEDAAEFLSSYGLKESGLTRLIRKTYELLGLIFFLHRWRRRVPRLDSCRADRAPRKQPEPSTPTWKSTSSARKPFAGINCWTRAQRPMRARKGTLRLEGKDYIVQDGDVMHIRHSG